MKKSLSVAASGVCLPTLLSLGVLLPGSPTPASAPEVAQPDLYLPTDAEPVARRRGRSPYNTCGVRNIDPSGGSPAVRASLARAADEFHVPRRLMFWLPARESKFRPTARNPHRIRGGNATGLVQHLDGYWPERVRAFNRKHKSSPVNASIYNVDSQARVTAWMLSGGMGKVGTHAWDC